MHLPYMRNLCICTLPYMHLPYMPASVYAPASIYARFRICVDSVYACFHICVLRYMHQLPYMHLPYMHPSVYARFCICNMHASVYARFCICTISYMRASIYAPFVYLHFRICAASVYAPFIYLLYMRNFHICTFRIPFIYAQLPYMHASVYAQLPYMCPSVYAPFVYAQLPCSQVPKVLRKISPPSNASPVNLPPSLIPPSPTHAVTPPTTLRACPFSLLKCFIFSGFIRSLSAYATIF
jgi:hypothetical protein